jgi:hypothetical protein
MGIGEDCLSVQCRIDPDMHRKAQHNLRREHGDALLSQQQHGMKKREEAHRDEFSKLINGTLVPDSSHMYSRQWW